MQNEDATASEDAKNEVQWEILLQALPNARSAVQVDESRTEKGRGTTGVAWVTHKGVWSTRDKLVISADSKLEGKMFVQDTVTFLPCQYTNEVETPPEEEQECQISGAESRNDLREEIK